MPGLKGSISLRMAMLTTLVGCVTSSAALFAMYSHYSEQARETVRKKSEAITHSLDAAASILGESPELVRMVHALGAEVGVKSIHLVDNDSEKVIASTENSMIGTSGGRLLSGVPRGQGSDQSRTSRQAFLDDSYRISLPVVIRDAGGDVNTGLILLEMDARPVHAEALRGMSQPAGIMLLGLLVTLTIVLMALHRTVFRPLTLVQKAMRSFSKGDTATRVPPLGANAVGALGEQLNRLFEVICSAKIRVDKQQAELIAARDEAEKATKLKSDFLATMSHEIRTPLNAIMGMAQMLNTAKLPDRQARYARIILDSAGMLLGLINDILDFSRIEAGKVTVEQAPFSLHGLLAELMEMQAPKAREKRLDLVLNIAPDVPDEVSGDAHRLRQVILNLVSNGVKFTSGGVVCVTVERAAAGKESVRFTVQDSGVGIAPEAQGKLFAKFSQADASTTRRFGGSGLGLAICNQLVGLMGGRIGFESRLGSGSTFWFDVKLKTDAEGSASRGSGKLRNPLGGAARVLVVDDQEICARAAQSMVAAADGSCDWVPDAATALEQLVHATARNTPYDVILLDKGLCDEGDAAELLREAEERAMPVVLWTGDGELYDEGARNLPAVRAGVSRIAASGRLVQVMQAAMDSRDPVVAASGPAHVPVRPVRRWEEGLRGLAVIIAEDVESHRAMLRSFLEQEGCTVGVAEDGLGAVELRASGGYDAIIMDCHMPVMDGFQATRQIRNMEREFDWPAMPVIALSGHVGPKDRDRCLKAGMNTHLAKPIDLRALKRVLLSEVCQLPAGPDVADTTSADPVDAVASPAPEAQGRRLFANPSVLVAEDCEVRPGVDGCPDAGNGRPGSCRQAARHDALGRDEPYTRHRLHRQRAERRSREVH